MTKISGFSYVHNAIDGGYPIVEMVRSLSDFVDEMVVVDAQSTDNTRAVLQKLGVTVLDGKWGNEAGKTLSGLHAMHTACRYDRIIHAEADEVWEYHLLANIRRMLEMNCDKTEYAVYRIQLEQNFQRIREYPVPVHRIFKKGTVVKCGRTTDKHNNAHVIPHSNGYLWDVTNCFRDNWINRIHQNAELWNEVPRYRLVPKHFLLDTELNKSSQATNIKKLLKQDHWTLTTTPINIPPILKPLVGQVEYMGRI